MHTSIPEVTGGCCYHWGKAAADKSKSIGKGTMLAKRKMPES